MCEGVDIEIKFLSHFHKHSNFTLYAVTGAYIANQSMIVNNALLPGAETFTLDSEKIVLGAGDVIKVAQSGTNNLSVVVSYLEV